MGQANTQASSQPCLWQSTRLWWEGTFIQTEMQGGLAREKFPGGFQKSWEYGSDLGSVYYYL